MRDLREDLKVCEAATEEPWEVVYPGIAENCRPAIIRADGLVVKVDCGEDFGDPMPDAHFVIKAREGWEEAIHRALAAEARVRELEEAVIKVLDSRVSMDGEMIAVSVDSLEELRMEYRKGMK